MGIGQLLISYWWIILLLIIIATVITRSLVKLLISIFLLTLVFVIFWQIFIASGFSDLNKCFTNEAERQTLIHEKAQSMIPGRERNQFICQGDALSFEKLTQCLNISRENNGLSFFIYSKLPYFRKRIEETITSHNQLCPETPLRNTVF